MLIGNTGLLTGMLIYSLLLPTAVLIFWKVKTKAKFIGFAAGAVCFTLFALVLESLLHQFVLMGTNPVSAVITTSPVLYTLYGAFAAGIFEETGRLFGFKILLGKHREKECATSYGIGHGGAEVILLLGTTYLTYILALIGVPMGSAEATEMIVSAAKSITPDACVMAAFERISAMVAHIGLSLLMFKACRVKGKLWLYPVSICLHALLDVPAALYQFGTLSSLLIVEILIFFIALIILIIGIKAMKNYSEETAIPESCTINPLQEETNE